MAEREMDRRVTVAVSEVVDVCRELFVLAGCEVELAESWVQIALERDMVGDYARGVGRLPSVLERVARGQVSRRLEVEVEQRSTLAARVFSTERNWPDQVGIRAAEVAVRIAKVHGVGFAAFPKPSIVGATLQPVLEAGMIGVALVQNAPLLNYGLAKENLVGNNPLAICAPGYPPFLFDGALSQYGLMNLVYEARRTGKMPEGAVLDREGLESTDVTLLGAIERRQRGAGSLMPLGGMKGIGLAMGLEFLAGALTGGFFAPPEGKPWGEGALVIALSAELFQHAEMVQQIQQYLEQFQTYPGQHAAMIRQRVMESGVISYPVAIIEAINYMAEVVGIEKRVDFT